MTKRERLFFALNPDDATRAAIAQRAAQVLAAGAATIGAEGCRAANARATAPENYHLTLAFLGSVDAEQRACFEAAVEQLEVPRLKLQLATVGYFSQARVIWVGLERVPPVLSEYAQHLWQHLQACGYVPDPRGFCPHITIARKAQAQPGVSAVEPVDWRCHTVALMRSTSHLDGVRYEMIRSWTATGSARDGAAVE